MTNLFGREPALWLAVASAFLYLLVGFGLGVSDGLAAAIMAVLAAAVAVWQAFLVRPVAPTLFGGFIAALAALLAYFGLHLTQEQIGLTSAAVAAVMVLLVRPQSTPAHDPVGDVAPAVTGAVRRT